MSTDFICLIEVAIDSLGSPEYETFATYFAPELISGYLEHERPTPSPELEEEARKLWVKLGERLMESVRR